MQPVLATFIPIAVDDQVWRVGPDTPPGSGTPSGQRRPWQLGSTGSLSSDGDSVPPLSDSGPTKDDSADSACTTAPADSQCMAVPVENSDQALSDSGSWESASESSQRVSPPLPPPAPSLQLPLPPPPPDEPPPGVFMFSAGAAPESLRVLQRRSGSTRITALASGRLPPQHEAALLTAGAGAARMGNSSSEASVATSVMADMEDQAAAAAPEQPAAADLMAAQLLPQAALDAAEAPSSQQPQLPPLLPPNPSWLPPPQRVSATSLDPEWRRSC